ncbi:M1 family metallopeptidase [Streptomyces sp. ZYX-F-203]
MRLRRRSALVAAASVVLSACGGGSGSAGAPGGSGVGDPYFPLAGNGGYDVAHYALDLDYDPDRRHVAGRATLTARATEKLPAFNLDLEGLEVEGVVVDGVEAGFDRAGQELTVRPDDPVDRGETFRVAIRYAGRPVTVTDPDGSREGWLPTEDGALALGQPVGSAAWFPGNHHPSDKATYDVAVSVPEGLAVVSNGEPAGTRTVDGRTRYAWRTEEPMAGYLAMLAIGRWEIERSRTADGLPIVTAVDPDQAAEAAPVLARIPEVLSWAEELFGPYPFSSAGAVVDRPADVGYALETQGRPVFPGAPDIVLLVHELAHQWFGDSVSPRTWRDMWLNEGFATYAEWLWQEEHGGDSAERTFRALLAGDHFEDPAADAAVWAFPPAEPPGAADISAAPVYQRGAMVLHRIRQEVGDDAFRESVRGWAAAHRHGNADTEDFVAHVERGAPDVDFTEIWERWLYGEGRPAAP